MLQCVIILFIVKFEGIYGLIESLSEKKAFPHVEFVRML